MAKIIKCSCKHESQDEIHGPGNRVHNEKISKIPGRPAYRCTVCLHEKEGA